MKKLQNNFTTPEQSKRLMELGVPADSADCYYLRMQHEEFENPRICYMSYFNHTYLHPKTFIYLPCWSVGRLIEIRDICAKYLITYTDFKGNYIENIIMSFYAIHATNGFDFSKLEE